MKILKKYIRIEKFFSTITLKHFNLIMLNNNQFLEIMKIEKKKFKFSFQNIKPCESWIIIN